MTSGSMLSLRVLYFVATPIWPRPDFAAVFPASKPRVSTMPDRAPNPASQRYRARAEECRIQAESFRDPKARTQMLQLAAGTAHQQSEHSKECLTA